MSESNFRTKMVKLARDALAFIKSWQDSKNEHHRPISILAFPREAEIDFSDFDELTIREKRNRLSQSMRAMQDMKVKVEIDSSYVFVQLLSVKFYESQLFLLMQQTEIDELRAKV